MSLQARRPDARTGSRASIRSVWDAVRRRLAGDRSGERLVRRALLGEAGVAAVESVSAVPGPAGRRHLLVRIRVAEGCDTRDVMRRATETLLRQPSVAAIHLLAQGSDGSGSQA